MGPAVLFIGPITYAQKEWHESSFFLSSHQYFSGSRDDFIHRCRTGEYNEIAAIYRSNEWTKITGPFNKELVQHLPNSLKYICHTGAGYDSIDIGACTERGISVSSTPGINNSATADVAIFLMLGALRRIRFHFRLFGEGPGRAKLRQAMTRMDDFSES